MTTMGGQIYLPREQRAAEVRDIEDDLEQGALEAETAFSGAKTNQELEERRKGNERLGVGGPVLDKPLTYRELALQMAQRALERMRVVQADLKARGIEESNPLLEQNIELMQEILKKAMHGEEQDGGQVMQAAMPLMKHPPEIVQVPERVRMESSEQLNLAHRELDQAQELLLVDARKVEGPDKGKLDGALKKSDVVTGCIHETLRMTGNIEHTLRFLARRTGELNDTLEGMLNLEGLVRRYEGLEEVNLPEEIERLAGKDPATLTAEEQQKLADFPQMVESIQIARENGVLWDQNGWETKADRERYLKGLAACVGMLQTRSKRGDLETQQAMQSFATHVILATTLIKMHFDLLKEVSRNMGPR